MLDELIPVPRKVEETTIELAALPAVVWQHLRHEDLGDSPFARVLFLLRTLPARLRSAPDAVEPLRLCVDDFCSTPAHPGFQVLCEHAPHELAVGAIGKVFQLDIPYVHVEDARAFAAFEEPGWVKVAWALRVEPLGETGSRVVVEVRVDATDPDSWQRFERYWLVIGPGSHFVRHALLAGLRRRFGDPDAHDETLALAGDWLLPDAGGQLTHGITIRATPQAIWPWLVQMGCGRAGFYAIDALDNGRVPSARELHRELEDLAVGDIIPASRAANDGFEVLALVPNQLLILGGLFDSRAHRQLPFTHERPTAYWHVTWSFVLEPRTADTTRLRVRARAAFSSSERLHLAWIRPVHVLMQSAQLRHLAQRAEGRLARDTLGDVAAGAGGAAVMVAAWLTPFMRSARNHWGLSAEQAKQKRAGDELVPQPRWSWTHAVEVDAPAAHVWPWVAQVGADRGGFYSYQWLENAAGCNLRNAETIHPEWQHRTGDELVLHPKIPPLRVVSVEAGESLVAFGAPDEAARAEGRPWAAASWAFCVEPLSDTRCRVVSRFRSACSDDAATRFTQGPWLLEPVGFAMDRRMLLGIRERAHGARPTA